MRWITIPSFAAGTLAMTAVVTLAQDKGSCTPQPECRLLYTDKVPGSPTTGSLPANRANPGGAAATGALKGPSDKGSTLDDPALKKDLRLPSNK